MGPDHACPTGGIGKGTGRELAVRQDIPNLVIAIGDRVRCAPSPIRTVGHGGPVEIVIAKVLIAGIRRHRRIIDRLHIAVGFIGIAEILIGAVVPFWVFSVHSRKLCWAQVVLVVFA
jgi:hypothetical protein